MWGTRSAESSIKCTRVCPTSERPGSKGTYIVRLSRANTRRLKARNGAYLKVSYGEASVLACLSDDPGLDDETIRMDQTLRTAICLEKIMQGSAAKELVYSPDAARDLEEPIRIERSAFRGPTLLARLVKQQYLICLVHQALSMDMETPIARLTNSSMEVIGIQSGDKILLISEKNRKPLRCLPLDTEGLPLEAMRTVFTPVCPDVEDQDMLLPWVTIDLQTRLDLGVAPWQPIIVGRDPGNAIVSEFGQVVLGVALAAVGGSIIAADYADISFSYGILVAGFVVLLLTVFKIRSRI